MIKKFLTLCFVALCNLCMIGCAPSESDICETAKDLISQKLAEINPENPATCLAVEITKQISENSWTAKAKLDNGKTMAFAMKLHENDILEVDYSAWLVKEAENEFKKEMKNAEKEFDREIKKAENEFKKEFDKEMKKAEKEFNREIDNIINNL